ncbi:MAG: hypothetical protein GY805_23475, partial [Chloroflexi bacterium]|nr:hypothetical protein [Chloroflexota bacterium]
DAGVRTLNRLKPWTRVGMGHCQGRICAPIIAQIAAHHTGELPEIFGTFTVRSPIKPIPMSRISDTVEHGEQLEWEDHATQYGYVRSRTS